MGRGAKVSRQTAETAIEVEVELDGRGQYDIATRIPFLDHMLSQLARHGFFDLHIQARGDLQVDFHHTVEDVGICLAEAFRQALGDKQGIRRYGQAVVPMIETLAEVALDLGGRPNLVYNVRLGRERLGDFDVELVEEFFRAFASHGGVDLHINMTYGRNAHHIIEAVFKAFAKALDQATAMEPRVQGVLSTKGKL